MNNKWRNIFLLFGLAAVIIMLFTFDMQWEEVWNNLKRAGYWFPLVIGIWALIYLFNTWAWYLIIRDDKKSEVPFWKLYKFSISGFALNYATPMGLMGGEPYRIMELTPYIGGSKATSSVILYVMTHIFSHFWFWLTSIPLYLILYPLDPGVGIMLGLIAFFCLLAIYFFLKGYRNGMALKTIRLCTKIPFLKKWALRFMVEKHDTLAHVDQQIAALHKQHKGTFTGALLLEYSARIIGCLEIWFILKILTPEVNFFDCILIQSFTSLFANLLFFSPMQLGAREGGFAIATGKLSMNGAFGVYIGLFTRIRELIWIAIGMLLMKIGNKKMQKNES